MDFEKFIREFNELNYFADENVSEMQLIHEKFAIDRAVLKTIGVTVIGSAITAVLTKIIDIQFQKKEVKSRLKRQKDSKDFRDKMALLDKEEKELRRELDQSEKRMKRTVDAVKAVKNPFLKKQLERTVRDEREKIAIIKTQLKKAS